MYFTVVCKEGWRNSMLYIMSAKFLKVKFSDTEAVSKLSENLTLPKISCCTVVETDLNTHTHTHSPEL